MAVMEGSAVPGMKKYTLVWLGLILIVAVEVALTYAHLAGGTLLAALLALATIEAAIGVMYFMHLRYERRVLFWTLIPALVFVLIMLNHLWRDAHRLILLSPHAS
jgi:cytochrome c oxidase subunit IV